MTETKTKRERQTDDREARASVEAKPFHKFIKAVVAEIVKDPDALTGGILDVISGGSPHVEPIPYGLYGHDYGYGEFSRFAGGSCRLELNSIPTDLAGKLADTIKRFLENKTPKSEK